MKKYYLFYLLFLGIPALLQAQPTLEFVQNKGQWDGDFSYKSRAGAGDIFLQKKAITYLLNEPGLQDKIDQHKHGHIKEAINLKYHVYRVNFEGCNPDVAIVPEKIQSHYYNYFLGNDSSRWKSKIHPALVLDYPQLYKGIDLHISSESANLKYDFIVQPGADPAQIKLKFEGVDKLQVNRQGNLLISTSVGNVQENKPLVYQYINDQRVLVPCRYELNGKQLTFSFPEGYDRSSTLIIDPTVVFCTFTGSAADNWGFTATYDEAGNLYAGGLVSLFRGGSFPVSTGAFQTTYGGGTGTGVPGSGSGGAYACDMGIMKINAAGNTKVYATYIGGSDNDQPHSMIVDKDNNLVIAGRTYSDNYPTSATAYDRVYNGDADIVITKLDNTGGSLIGSTYIGGTGPDCVNIHADEFTFGSLKHNYGDDSRSEVILDDDGNVYVAAATSSGDFPTVNAIQATLGGGQDAVLVKLNPNLSNLLLSTYLGGSDDDAGYVLGLNNAGTSIYIAGGTRSAGFPSTTGTYRPNYMGNTDGYILKISNAIPYTLQRGTFIGTGNYDQVFGIQIDMDDDVYVMGQTLGGTFPVSTGVYSNPNSSQFVMKIDNNLNAPIYSTVFGSGTSSQTNISPVAFLVDTCENVYISGWGGNLGDPTIPLVGNTTGMPVTPSTALMSTTDGSDFYFIVLSKNATSLLYGSFFGRNSTDPRQGEHVDGGTSRFDRNGIIYQAICGGCLGGPAFPTTAGSLSPRNGSSNCNLAALKISFELGAVVAHIDVSPDAKGCPPFTVNFKNTTFNARTYTWDFADGSGTSTIKEPTHTFYTPGVYRVRMVAHNPDACIEYDTAYLQIIVDSNSIESNFDITILDSCTSPYQVFFKNNSRTGKSGKAQYIWDFGDGSGPYYGETPPVHRYKSQGTYIVSLIMIDTSACNSPDTMRKNFTLLSKFVKATVNIPDVICVKAGGLYFANLSTNATSAFWDFGDGTTSTELSPTHKYDTGTFTITVVVSNPNTCNLADTLRKTITIKPGATADFIHAPMIPNPNDSIRFTNLSKNALSYLWIFGDGEQSRAEHPAHLFRKTGTYKTCLVAKGFGNCDDTLCKNVEALIVPLLDVPTAFTPNGDGVNDIIYVRGAAIETLDFKIYNRWGQVVFETKTQEVGWDGKFNGQPQPMESYGYVLKATFIDGTTEEKKGNITLLE